MASKYSNRYHTTPEILEFKAKVKSLWYEGLSCAMIAKDLGVTRNKVIGHVYRMKLGPEHRMPGRDPKWTKFEERLKAKRILEEAKPKRKYVRRDVVPTPAPISRPREASYAPPNLSESWRDHRATITFRKQKTPELSKEQLRRQLEDAMRNTALLPKPVITSEGS